MKIKTKIRIDKDYKRILHLAIMYYTIFVGFFTFHFNLPASALYLADLINLILLFGLSRRIIKIMVSKELRWLTIILIVTIILGTLSAVWYGFNLGRWIWSLRNWGRFFSYFFITIAVFKVEQCKKILEWTVSVYHINFFVILIQFFLFRSNYTQDSLNGLYGRNVNGVLILNTLIVLSIVTGQYIVKTMRFREYILLLAEIGIVAVVAELRAIAVFTIVIVGICILVSKKTSVNNMIKNLLIFFLLLLGAGVITYLVSKIYPEFYSTFNLKSILSSATNESGYGFNGGVDRLNFITILNRQVLDKRRFWINLLGIGMGNAEYSTIASLTSPFYLQYKNLMYLNFTASSLYIEIGIIGLLLFVSIFMIFAIKHLSGIRNIVSEEKNKETLYFEILGLSVSLINLMFIVYNNVHRTDMSFILAFYTALPFVIRIRGKKLCEKK